MCADPRSFHILQNYVGVLNINFAVSAVNIRFAKGPCVLQIIIFIIAVYIRSAHVASLPTKIIIYWKPLWQDGGQSMLKCCWWKSYHSLLGNSLLHGVIGE